MTIIGEANCSSVFVRMWTMSESVTWPGGGDEYRLGRTVEELNELQGKLANHVYDERELDEVISSLGRVASYNRMAPRDRDILNDDIEPYA